ncbi:XRE family transcriptional regulator [Rhizobium lentis]|uniref:XRE family transcriptional regulator n=1 Tax=Rhizobium lentis TaxID=1138194 RepID=UPI001C83BAA8|nr:XRE family transcriptional regulator [Rhizobium lentis]MBX4954751.1 ImmA/IrrE family metallo-endopeptidase [Rhizobium lentis]MBX5034530.1 ImmA/IrrE family metallo-endopeptidase [Rhizobium lentis]
MKNIFGARLAAVREQREMSLQQAALELGLMDSNEVAAYERGDAQPTPALILKAMTTFHVPIETFTDPFRLVNEGRFSWRQSGVSKERLSEYEEDAGSFIAAYRVLKPKVAPLAPAEPKTRLLLTSEASDLIENSKFERVSSIAESLGRELELGPVPANKLADAIEKNLGILVLMVNPTEGISGAACKLTDLDVILINRNDVPGRRNFDMGHELFHILTWRNMPPAHIEDINERNKSRVEQLADIFASSLLMPEYVIRKYGEWRSGSVETLVDKLNKVADELHVSSSALGWRLVSLGILEQSARKAISEDRLRFNGRKKPEIGDLPPLFSLKFMELMQQALSQGQLSIRRAAKLLQLNIDQLHALFAEHGITSPFEI